jgi:Ca-activated chloride channel family protein
MRNLLLVLSLFLLSMFSLPAQNASDTPASIIFIYDASGSMWGAMEGKTKMQIAGRVLSQTLDQLPPTQPIGLFVYGHRRERDCQDVEWLVPLTNLDKNLLREAIGGIKPLGRTPLARSAQQVLDELRISKQKATIILITDGIESCDGELCEVVRLAKNEGIEFKLHIVGFGLKDDETAALRCAAEAGEGEYYDAANAISLAAGLIEATSATIEEIPAPMPDQLVRNLSVFATKNGVAIDAWVVAKPLDSDERATTLRTYADTSYMSLLPGRYQLAFRPLENSDVNTKSLGEVIVYADSLVHRSISFDAGKIAIHATKNGAACDAVFNIFPSGSNDNVAGGRTYAKTTITELDPGSYTVKLSVLKVDGQDTDQVFEDVLVNANETFELTHDFSSGELSLQITNNNELWDATFKVKDPETGASVSSGRTYAKPVVVEVNPGVYDLEILALKVEGKERSRTIASVVVKATETTEVTHNFDTGELSVGVSSSAGLVDAVISVKELETGAKVSGGRTYTRETTNPWKVTIFPGTYQVEVRGLGDFKDRQETFTIQVVAGQKAAQSVRF